MNIQYIQIYKERYGEYNEKLRHPFIFVSGKHHKNEWEAKVNVVQWFYAVTAYTL